MIKPQVSALRLAAFSHLWVFSWSTSPCFIIIIIIIIIIHSSLYADVNGFLNPSIITGENYRPDLLFLIQSKCLYVLELTVGFESNLNNNAMRKKGKYLELDQRNEQKLQMCEICKPLLKLPWRFLRRMFHVLRHDE